MPTYDDLKTWGVDPNDPKALEELKARLISENEARVAEIIFVCRELGELVESHGREWLVVERAGIRFQMQETEAYHKAGTVADWLWTRIVVVSMGSKRDDFFPFFGPTRVAVMNVSDHAQSTAFPKGNNVFVPGEWLRILNDLVKEAGIKHNAAEKKAKNEEAARLLTQLLVGQKV